MYVYGFTWDARTTHFRFMQWYYIMQKGLAERIGVSASRLRRGVSGETKTVSNDILMGVAHVFKVPTDYILGLSSVSVRKSYGISELGLSEGVV